MNWQSSHALVWRIEPENDGKRKKADRETLTRPPTSHSQLDTHAMVVTTTNDNGGHTKITLLIFPHRCEHLIWFFASMKCDSQSRKANERAANIEQQQQSLPDNIELNVVCIMCAHAHTNLDSYRICSAFSIAINTKIVIIDETFWLRMAYEKMNEKWLRLLNVERK